jgi:hypothetical protein
MSCTESAVFEPSAPGGTRTMSTPSEDTSSPPEGPIVSVTVVDPVQASAAPTSTNNHAQTIRFMVTPIPNYCAFALRGD